MSNLFISIYSGGGGVKFMKYIKGGASYERFGTSAIYPWGTGIVLKP
jgi:hypothetical protein